MYFLYSFIVVAPITFINPLAKEGFKRFQASALHSWFQAQTMVCISSINNIISHSEDSTSFITDFSLSSNSHLYLAPAIRAPKSKVNIFLFKRTSGTSLSIIFLAIHSTIAVFQTQGSQIKTGLFFSSSWKNLNGSLNFFFSSNNRIYFTFRS